MGRSLWPRLKWKLWAVRWRWVVLGAAALAIPVAVYLGVVIVRSNWQGHQTLRLTAVAALIGIVGTTVAIVSNLLAIQRGSEEPKPEQALLEPRLTRDDLFVDRSRETVALAAAVEKHPVTNLVGAKGSGKSHFLAYVGDVLNGHRQSDDARAKLGPLARFRVLYFDLSEALGFDDVLKQMFEAHFPDKTASWEQFTSIIDRAFGHLPLILVLDNVNAEGISAELGRAVYRYLARRAADRVVIGSIRPIEFLNLSVYELPFEGFDELAIGEFASASEISLDPEQVAGLRERSGGLPLFLRLLFAHWDQELLAPAGVSSGVRHLLKDTILPRLGTEATDLLVGIALLSVVSADVAETDLERLPVSHVGDHLEELKAYSLLRVRTQHGQSRAKLHDLVRDAVIDLCDPQVRTTAHSLSRDFVNRGAEKEGALLWLYAAPLGLDSDLVETLERVIFAAVESKDYPFLGSLSLIVASRAATKQLSLTDRRLASAFLHARASVLAGRGQYVEALEELQRGAAVVLRRLRGADPELSPIEFEIAYLEANLLHLQNRYDESFEAFQALREVTNGPAFESNAARVEWALGHVLRHQALDLKSACSHFDAAETVATELDDFPTRLLSITGRLGIEIYLDCLPPDAEERLEILERTIAAEPRFVNYMPKIWKSRSQVLFRRGDRSEAKRLIGLSIDRALEMNDRLLFNFRFERAEYSRLDGQHASCIDDYVYVLEAGRANGDRNLIANALLGLAESDLSSDKLLYHRSRGHVRATVLQARAIAADAEIYATGRQAEQTLLRLEGQHNSEARLILF